MLSQFIFSFFFTESSLQASPPQNEEEMEFFLLHRKDDTETQIEKGVKLRENYAPVPEPKIKEQFDEYMIYHRKDDSKTKRFSEGVQIRENYLPSRPPQMPLGYVPQQPTSPGKSPVIADEYLPRQSAPGRPSGSGSRRNRSG